MWPDAHGKPRELYYPSGTVRATKLPESHDLPPTRWSQRPSSCWLSSLQLGARLEDAMGHQCGNSAMPTFSGQPLQPEMLYVFRHASLGRVEDGRGSLGPMANAPFPIPAHRNG